MDGEIAISTRKMDGLRRLLQSGLQAEGCTQKYGVIAGALAIIDGISRDADVRPFPQYEQPPKGMYWHEDKRTGELTLRAKKKRRGELLAFEPPTNGKAGEKGRGKVA